jgi:hypothetical protein
MLLASCCALCRVSVQDVPVPGGWQLLPGPDGQRYCEGCLETVNESASGGWAWLFDSRREAPYAVR